MLKQNLFENIPESLPEEIIETIAESKNVKIERIISKGHSSPKNFWYDQEKNELVTVLKGKAKLIFNENELVELCAGDYLNIPAHKKHRVEWTDPDTETIWLAIFY